ncbi:MAG TPA: outer-membrane lipoprotein carrier protein LolA [Beijerinckiaceae bacterium]|jgi:outer membrane lipoprotein-sorting protein|nr:outer-membrane lipoprotein carrier protein LolA [Beijerinckiaceae bacterium]
MKYRAAIPLAALGRALLALTMILPASAAFAEASPPRPPMDLNPPAAKAAPAVAPQTSGAAGKKAVAATNATPAPFNPYTAIEKANAYFNNAATMVGDFVQVGADGRRSEGKLYVQRPGRLRFEYAQPASLEVIADGTKVAIRDRKLSTQDLYFIQQTPLKFLLKDKIDLAKDTKVLDVTNDPNNTTIVIEDGTTLGGTSKIRLMFDPSSYQLKQWLVTDPQGYDTLVSLYNVDFKEKPDPSLFTINY